MWITVYKKCHPFFVFGREYTQYDDIGYYQVFNVQNAR